MEVQTEVDSNTEISNPHLTNDELNFVGEVIIFIDINYNNYINYINDTKLT